MAEEEPEFVLVSEVKELLEKESEERDELRYEQKLALEHARAFARLDPDDARELYEEALKLDRVSPANAAKIADLCPQHPDDVRAIFQKERYNLEEDEVQNILDTVAKYV